MDNINLNRNTKVYKLKLPWIEYVKPFMWLLISLPFFISFFVMEKKISFYFIMRIVMSIIFLQKNYIIIYIKMIRIYLSQNFISLKQEILSYSIDDISISKIEGVR